MGEEVLVLILPLVATLLPFAFVRLRERSGLASRRSGPLISSEALNQLTLNFIIYFMLLIVPVGGRVAGDWGRPVSLFILFLILISLLLRFKKLGDG